MGDTTTIIIIPGYGTSSGLTAFFSGTITPALATAMGINSNLAALEPLEITLPAQTLNPLDVLASDVGYSFTLADIAFGFSSDTRSLFKSRGTAYTTNGSPIRLQSPIDDSTTPVTFDVTEDANFASGLPKLIWMKGECMSVTAASGNQLTATRAQLDTEMVRHPFTGGGAILHSEPPPFEGQRIKLYQGPSTATTVGSGSDQMTLLHIGVIDGIGSNETGDMVVRVSSHWATLMDRQWSPPRNWSPVLGSPMVRIDITSLDGTPRLNRGDIYVDTDAHGTDEWDYVRLIVADGDAKGCWCVIDPGDVETLSDYRVNGHTLNFGYYAAADDVVPIAFGRDEAFMDPATWYRTVSEAQGDDHVIPCHAELAQLWTDAKVSDVVGSLIGGSSSIHAMMTLGLTADEYDADSLTILDDNLHVDLADKYVLPLYEDAKIVDILVALIKPLFCGLPFGSDGKLRAISWTEDYTTLVDLAKSDLEEVAFSESLGGVSQSVAYVKYSDKAGGGLNYAERHSDVAQQYNGRGGKHDLSTDPFAVIPEIAEILAGRADEVMVPYAWGCPVVAFTVTAAKILQVGDTVRLTHDQIVDVDGSTSLGLTDVTGIVYSRGETIVNGVQSVSIALTGMTRQGDLAEWGPAAEINGTHAATTTPTIHSASYSDDDDASFSDYAGAIGTGAVVYLVDEDGTRRDTNGPTITSVSPLTLSAAFDVVNYNDRDSIIVGPYTAQPSAIQSSDLAFFASDTGQLDGGTDNVDRYA